eukprot:4014886-Pleurochrysis_carterae.AAC.2
MPLHLPTVLSPSVQPPRLRAPAQTLSPSTVLSGGRGQLPHFLPDALGPRRPDALGAAADKRSVVLRLSRQ